MKKWHRKTATLMGVLLLISAVNCSSTATIEDDAEVVEDVPDVADEPETVDEEVPEADWDAEASDTQPEDEEPTFSDSEILPVADSPILGDPEAPVTIVAFLSTECAFSALGADRIEKIVDRYDGDVRMVFKHFSLGIHRDGQSASRFMEAARRQNEEVFWDMKSGFFDRLVRDQSDDSVEDHAMALGDEFGLDTEQLLEDYHDPKLRRSVEADEALARRLEITGTPHFIINGERISGARPYEKFAELVDQKLEEADKMLARGVERSDLYAEAISQNMDVEPPSEKEPDSAEPQDEPAEPQDEPPEVVDSEALEALTIPDFQTRGPDDAPVTIFGFIGFQCPFSARGVDILEEVVDEYGDDVRLVYKHFPLAAHEFSKPASRAAVAAGHQGKFFEMHDALFANQQKFSEPDILEQLAKELDLDIDQFNEDMESTSTAKQIEQDHKEGKDAEVRGTPVYFVNDQFVRGAQPVEVFRELIDQQLDKAD